MSTATHTPGEWSYHIGRGKNPRWHIATKHGGYQIASTPEISPAKAEAEEQEANARLLSAAPDLLEASKNAANVLAALATGQLKSLDKDSPALAALRDAVAKATGGS
jgi:hypothetical protein